ncbi:MAG: cobalt-precorrin-6A reductase [Stappia sp.]|uniref:cobalt-precorrin-6A reductase n=1 Tax=Stappia sp. TaxID=1870903 RepID=UPI000C5728D2|nr:cobalt-precorrin-6A reductase [Stappia sp.]MAB01152.1 cobalt-precorrin-6A reductase [Stappia sp.]MBM19844.1 cobalt-precorrin-6A reductase [Stappia sp.]
MTQSEDTAPLKVLVLGGTGDARALAARLVTDTRFSASVSLAGAVERPDAYPLPVRSGGFGGVEGLSGWIRDNAVGALVDATHPFATGISRNAAEAARATATPLVRLERPAWRAGPADRWQEVDDLDEAVAALPPGARPFLAIGRKEIARFASRSDLDCLMRMIDPPGEEERLPRGRLVLARPVRDADAEVALLSEHGATHVVAKNSGGPWGEAKLIAARRLGLPVILLRRPPALEVHSVPDVDGVLDWLESLSAR